LFHFSDLFTDKTWKILEFLLFWGLKLFVGFSGYFIQKAQKFACEQKKIQKHSYSIKYHQSLKKNNNKRKGTNQANYSINIPFKLELALGRHKIYVFY